MNSIERITLRIPINLMKILKKESEDRTLPINAIITRLLHKDLIQEAKFNVFPVISMPPMILYKIIDKLDQSEIDAISKIGLQGTKKYFALINQGYTVENMVSEYFTMLAKRYGWFNYRFDKNDRKYRLVFETTAGTKWTKLVYAYVKSALLSTRVHIEQESIEDNIIIFEFTDMK